MLTCVFLCLFLNFLFLFIFILHRSVPLLVRTLLFRVLKLIMATAFTSPFFFKGSWLLLFFHISIWISIYKCPQSTYQDLVEITYNLTEGDWHLSNTEIAYPRRGNVSMCSLHLPVPSEHFENSLIKVFPISY